MLRCGLLGEKLGHSWSPAIHAMLGDYEYKLYERSPKELESFLKEGNFHGLNVTIPYKKAVVPYCAELSPLAEKIGSVNTLIRRPDGSLYGDNTDAAGFSAMLTACGVSVTGKKTLVLGSGGASVMVCAVLRELGTIPVVISRTGENHYGNLHLHADAHLIVNTTPVGMYPHNGASPVDLSAFPNCCGVLDLVYNPARTALLLQAEELGIPHMGGLHMLVEQARCASEHFTGTTIPAETTHRIEKTLARRMENIILVGMPGSGKSTIATLLGEALGRAVEDSDARVEQLAGKPIPQIFAEEGEGHFRALESAALAELGKGSGLVIATGGGSVLREENYRHLRQNGTIFWLKREVSRLPKEGRPISQQNDLEELYRLRAPRYERFADYTIDNNASPADTLSAILRILEVQP